MEKIKVNLSIGIISSNSKAAFNLNSSSFFGEKTGEKIVYSIYEAFYLLENKKIEVNINNKRISNEEFIKKCNKLDKNFILKALVFSDLRKKGYILKTALKMGADFRVYAPGENPNKAHARWLLAVYPENSGIKWSDYAAKNRLAHSTNKKLLIAIIDSEQSISYYESSWKNR